MTDEPRIKIPDLDDLYRKYYGLVQMQHYRLTGNFHTAEDLTQDTFEKVARNFHRYDDSKASFKTWITCIAKNIAIDYFRRRKTIYTQAEFAEDGSAHEGRNPITPEDEAIGREMESRLGSFFAAHPHQKSAETLQLKLSGHSGKDISELLNLGSMAIKLRQLRIKKQLEQYFQDELQQY